MFGKLKLYGLALCAAMTLTSCSSDIGVVANYTEDVSIYGEPIVQTGVVYDQAVDILFIVDESGSMSDDWETLAATMPEIYSILIGPEFTDLKWRVGIKSTDSAGEIYGWVDYNDPDALLKLMSLTSLLENHYREAGLDSALETVAWDNSGFEREEADLLIVYISDEPDQSSVSPTEYNTLMDLVKSGPFEVTESAIVATYEGNRCDSAQLGVGYLDVSETVVDLCDEDWSAVLDRPKEHLPTLNEVWHLDHLPLQIDKLKVFLSEDGSNSTEYDHWRYDENRNAVVLTDIPDSGGVLTIVYTI
jgi:hypothetical protein